MRIVYAFSILVLLMTGVFAKRGYLEWRRIERQNRSLELQIKETSNKTKELQRKMHRLRTSRAAQDILVRSSLGYVKPGEWVVDLD